MRERERESKRVKVDCLKWYAGRGVPDFDTVWIPLSQGLIGSTITDAPRGP